MNRVLAIIVFFAVGFGIGYFVPNAIKGNGGLLSGLSQLPNAYSSGGDNKNVSVGYWTKILSKDADRQWASVCNDGAGVVYLSETSTTPTATTTYIGFPIASSTAYNHCYFIDADHPYFGDVYGLIGSTTTVVRVIDK